MSTQTQSAGPFVPEWTLADRFRKIRTINEWSQKEIAEQLQVTSSAYAQWEAGNARPRQLVSVAQRLELLTGIPAWWTLGLNAENRRPGGPDGEGITPSKDYKMRELVDLAAHRALRDSSAWDGGSAA